ncbi:hypothetical protein QBC34DRAFT_184603 [Podospora aff. communis PSN243]|uniref:25S rRNA (Uridine(2843)-N(3))-methyltransferase n=1 Tax=Podospora aff. communis PSN243 TaxID=3040156 RepID=A0AAV9GBD1_9PEZI|nr:hypothetical protein QBC34DRAFT_184603 [Podospora aff. communis PSN243]
MVKKTGARAGNRQRRSSLPIPGTTDFQNTKKQTSKPSTKKNVPAKKDAVQQVDAPAPSPEEEATTHHQQLTLNTYKHTFSDVLSSAIFKATLQSVKQALFDRDFARAFSTEEYLRVYAARYSPTRSLCYTSVLTSIRDHLDSIATPTSSHIHNDPTPDPDTAPVLKHLSIGGGAAETVAFGSFLSLSQSPLRGEITLLDSAAWGPVVSSLTSTLTTPASSTPDSDTNEAFISPALFTSTFSQTDAFTLDGTTFPSLLGSSPLLVSMMFTLNELFTSGGIGKTTRFLLDLTSSVPIGSLLLVVDSPGSYSETTLGKEAKRYPMQWLLDRIMLGTQKDPVGGRRWKKLESEDSVWCRLSEKLVYPIRLENMRYQLHLYKAEAAADDS